MQSVRMASIAFVLLSIVFFGQAPAVGAEGLRLGGKAVIYEAPARKALDLTDEVTLEAWVKADKMGHAGGRILDKSVPGTSDAYMLDTYPGNSLRFVNAKGACTYDAKLAADRWTHVVAVYSASKRIMKLYVNGTEVASADGGSFVPMTVTQVPLRLGWGVIPREAIASKATSNERRSTGGP